MASTKVIGPRETAQGILEAAGFTVGGVKPDGTIIMDAPSDWSEPVRASAARPDLIDVFGSLAEAANDILASANSIFDAHRFQHGTERPRATARAAALRVIAALDAYEQVRG